MGNVIRIDEPKQAQIEIEIGDSGITLTYTYTDDKLLDEGKGRRELIDKMKNIDTTKEDDTKVIKEMQSSMKEAFDMLFGEGTYEILFDKYQSSMVLANVFFKTNEAIDKEMNERSSDITNAVKSKKYLRDQNEKKAKKEAKDAKK